MLLPSGPLYERDVQLAIPSRVYDGIAGMVRRATAHKRGVSPSPE